MTKGEFALNAIKSYYKDPSSCGYDENGGCMYITPDGRKCVLGKYLIDPKIAWGNAKDVLRDRRQNEVLIPEAVDILNWCEWVLLQELHDAIAYKNKISEIQECVRRLGLFTWEELIS